MTRESAAAAYIRVRPPPYRARARSCDLLVQWRLPLDAFAHALALAARAKAKGAVAAVGTEEATAELEALDRKVVMHAYEMLAQGRREVIDGVVRDGSKRLALALCRVGAPSNDSPIISKKLAFDTPAVMDACVADGTGAPPRLVQRDDGRFDVCGAVGFYAPARGAGMFSFRVFVAGGDTNERAETLATSQPLAVRRPRRAPRPAACAPLRRRRARTACATRRRARRTSASTRRVAAAPVAARARARAHARRGERGAREPAPRERAQGRGDGERAQARAVGGPTRRRRGRRRGFAAAKAAREASENGDDDDEPAPEEDEAATAAKALAAAATARTQIEWYFSAENMEKDEYLRKQAAADPRGDQCVALSTILGFKRTKKLLVDAGFAVPSDAVTSAVALALRMSPALLVDARPAADADEPIEFWLRARRAADGAPPPPPVAEVVALRARR